MLTFFLVGFLASTAGAICGIGGGVIIKPVLDLLRPGNVSAISFLSGCTVLAMSCYSVGHSLLSGKKSVSLDTGTPLAIGAAAGGLLGSRLFSAVRGMFEDQNRVGAVQAACLALVTAGTLLYTIKKDRIPAHPVSGRTPCVLIGLALGCMSSFLGIGGGPINLLVLYFFFGMDTRTAAANSLYIILFSQLANVLTVLLTGAPPFRWQTLVLMVLGGIGGGAAGRYLNRKLDDRAVDRLFIGLMVLIIGISLFNVRRFLAP